MKKWIAAVMMVMMVFTVTPAPVFAASEDTIVDKAGDWFATLGKSGADKDMILMQRQTERAANRLGKSMKAEGKELSNKMGKMFE